MFCQVTRNVPHMVTSKLSDLIRVENMIYLDWINLITSGYIGEVHFRVKSIVH